MYEQTDLPEFTQYLASSFEFAAKRLGLDLMTDCPAWTNDDPAVEPIYIARDMWEKIVLNLVSNALKFTWNGEVKVSLHRVESGAELTVKDTGIGIPEEYMPRLFERFFRVQTQDITAATQPARSHEGTGIGLPLTKELVALHGGTISVTSRVGEGTEFKVFIPSGCEHLPVDQVRKHPTPPHPVGAVSNSTKYYANETMAWVVEKRRHSDPSNKIEKSAGGNQEDTKDEDEATLSRWEGPDKDNHAAAVQFNALLSEKRPRVLLVDDNVDILRYVTSLLEPFATVITASNGEVALSIATSPEHHGEEERLDLVLSDVMMPVMDGFALLRALRENPATASIPVILLSARAGQESTVEGLERGADDYIIKPFAARELIAKVKGAINLCRLRQQLVDTEKREVERRHIIATILERIRSGATDVHQIVTEALRDLASILGANRLGIFELWEGAPGKSSSPTDSASKPEHSPNEYPLIEYRCAVTFEHINDKLDDSSSSSSGSSSGKTVERVLGRQWTTFGWPNSLSIKSPAEFRQRILKTCSSEMAQRHFSDILIPILVNDRVWGAIHALRTVYVY